MLREFLMLAKTMRDDRILNFYISEKLDGTRAFWDGGLSRGVPTVDVPWANIYDPKNPRQLKRKIKPVATGLWSRYGNPIAAPDWFLNKLPCCPLDGELWADRGGFQVCRSVCAKDTPIDGEWKKISYVIYGSPCLSAVFGDGEIRNANFRTTLNWNDCKEFIKRHATSDYSSVSKFTPFTGELEFLRDAFDCDYTCYLHRQRLLPKCGAEAQDILTKELQVVLDMGGEGVVLRDSASIWRPKRVSSLLKVKPSLDDVGVLVGYTAGRKTSRGSSYVGKIGALVLDYKGIELKLSGMAFHKRQLTPAGIEYARQHEGERLPSNTEAAHFKIGDRIEFKYRELSDTGVPKDARFIRVRENV